jgi:hypothetical protein
MMQGVGVFIVKRVRVTRCQRKGVYDSAGFGDLARVARCEP